MFFFLFFFSSYSLDDENFHQKDLCGNIREAPGGDSPFAFPSLWEKQCEQQACRVVLCKTSPEHEGILSRDVCFFGRLWGVKCRLGKETWWR